MRLPRHADVRAAVALGGPGTLPGACIPLHPCGDHLHTVGRPGAQARWEPADQQYLSRGKEVGSVSPTTAEMAHTPPTQEKCTPPCNSCLLCSLRSETGEHLPGNTQGEQMRRCQSWTTGIWPLSTLPLQPKQRNIQDMLKDSPAPEISANKTSEAITKQ